MNCGFMDYSTTPLICIGIIIERCAIFIKEFGSVKTSKEVIVASLKVAP
jgi:hypothetical protein